MEKAKLREARKLIETKQYPQAKELLSTMLENDTAMKWYLQLEAITASEPSPKKKRTSWQKYRLFVLGAVIVGLIVLVVALQAITAESACRASIALGGTC